MTALRYLVYVLACQFYCLRLAVYLIHSALVFLTKPGARLVVPLALLGLVYALRGFIEAQAGPAIDAFWQGAVRPLIGSDLYGLLSPFDIEISALVVLLLFAVAFALLSSMLRPLVGTFAAPRQPLPPLPPMVVPDTQVRTVKARVAMPERSRSGFDGDLGALLDRVPEHVRQVVESARSG